MRLPVTPTTMTHITNALVLDMTSLLISKEPTSLIGVISPQPLESQTKRPGNPSGTARFDEILCAFAASAERGASL